MENTPFSLRIIPLYINIRKQKQYPVKLCFLLWIIALFLFILKTKI